MTGQITTIDVPTPPRLTGNSSVDVSLISEWAWGLWRSLVLANPVAQRVDRIAGTEPVAAFVPTTIADASSVAVMTGSETLAQTITKVNELIPLVVKVNETVGVLALAAEQLASVSAQLNAAIAAAARE